MSWIGHPSVSFLDNQDGLTTKDYPTNLAPLLGDSLKDYYYLFHQGRQQNTFVGKILFPYKTNHLSAFQGCFLSRLGFRA